MAGYSPLYIRAMETGLVQSRQEFILPNDAYPVLENAYVWREKIIRKQGCQLLGRLQRNITISSPATNNLLTGYETNSSLVPGSINIIDSLSVTWTDPDENGVLVPSVGSNGTVNYSTGLLTGPTPTNTGTFSYNPNLPVMGLNSRETASLNNEELVAFDQKYAYIFNGTTFEEFLSNTAATWSGTDYDFFWTTNYWVGDRNLRIFWATNFSGTSGDPIRYTNGVALTDWVDFSPQINNAGDVLGQCLMMVPYRGRLLAFNTLEGSALSTSAPFPQRIRWAAIGNPFTTTSAIVSTVNANAWRDDIRGQGGFLDIPTSEAITSVGFVRDNLVIYCERSTWQLRYTGRSISPFQIERVNSELGAESTFSAVQFDTSLVGVGNYGIVECDSFQSKRIDIKIPDLVFEFNNDNHGLERVHGIRNFLKKLAYWTYPYAPDDQQTVENFFPNKRLVYNYENDSWAIFDDSFTTFGNYQPVSANTWEDYSGAQDIWSTQNDSWISRPALIPLIVGGNQQGYVEILDQKVTNDVSLYITNITGNSTTPTVIQSINHNLLTGQVVELFIPPIQAFDNLNEQVFSIVKVDKDNFQLWIYDLNTGEFSLPQLDSPATYIGNGQIIVRDNFNIVSKKFNFLEDGQNIQLGFIDILMNNTEDGAISLKVYLDYNENTPVNIPPENADPISELPDTFFNSVVPTSVTPYIGSSKNWQRVFCCVRGAFITIEWTFSNSQMAGNEQETDVQIDSQILWIRKAGKQLPIGI